MSYREAIRLNAWAPVAVLAALVSRLWLRDPGLVGAGRVAVALLPLVPGLLYVRSLWRWMRRQDELQRRLQFEAVGFAALAMLFVALTVDLLQLAGFAGRVHFGWEGYFAFTFFLYALGLARAKPGLPMKSRVRELRTEREWSQAELAAKLGVSRQTINAIETEIWMPPSLPLALKIAKLFRQPVERIFDGDGDGDGDGA